MVRVYKRTYAKAATGSAPRIFKRKRSTATKYKYKGKGDYNGFKRGMKKALKYAVVGIPTVAGAMIGGSGALMDSDHSILYKQYGYKEKPIKWGDVLIGAAGGASTGFGVGQAVSKMAGLGDYTSANQIVKGSKYKPLSVNAGNNLSGDVYIHHREFIGNVTALWPANTAAGTTGFQLMSYPINPGMSQTFPFLAQIAQNFTLYELQGLIFEYKPTSGEYGASNSNQLGKVVLATNYDPDAAVFTTSQQMENYDYANAVKPSQHAIHGVECKPAQRATQMLYVRAGANSKDKVFTDIGLFQVATEGIAMGSTLTLPAQLSNLGELWVTYKCKLSRAALYSTSLNQDVSIDMFLGYAGPSSMTQNTAAQLPAPAVGLNYASKYAPPAVTTLAAQKLTNTLGGVLSSPDATHWQYNFSNQAPAGSYMLTWQVQGLAATQGLGVVTPINCINTPNSGTVTLTASGNAGQLVYIYYIDVTAQQIQLGASINVQTTATNQQTNAQNFWQITQVCNGCIR